MAICGIKKFKIEMYNMLNYEFASTTFCTNPASISESTIVWLCFQYGCATASANGSACGIHVLSFLGTAILKENRSTR